MNEVKIHLAHGGGIQTPTDIILHSMAEYIIVDPATAKRYGIKVGEYHALQWLDILGLSAHALIAPTGVSIRCRNDDEMAWHAKSNNSNTLGIEFLVPGAYGYYDFIQRIKTPYLTDDQFHCGQEQIREWVEAWNIESIKTHNEIDPGRKHDPGAGFPTNEFLQEL